MQTQSVLRRGEQVDCLGHGSVFTRIDQDHDRSTIAGNGHGVTISIGRLNKARQLIARLIESANKATVFMEAD